MVDVINMCKPPPLHRAIYSGGEESVKILLDEGADVDVFDEKNRTPLSTALIQRNEKITKLLIDYGADVNLGGRSWGFPLQLAIDWGNEEIVKSLLDKKTYVNANCGCGRTILTKASIKGNLTIIRSLLEHGADVEARDHLSNMNALEMAVGLRKGAVIKALNDRKADMNESDRRNSPLRNAVRGEDLKTVKFLLDHGANVDVRDRHGNSLLHLATEFGSKEIIKALLDKGADINAIGEGGDTPLHSATTDRNSEIVRLLLDHGANANTGDFHGATPLHQAHLFHDERTIKVLLDNQADVNVESSYHRTPLHEAAAHPRGLSNCKLLMEYGADVNVTDRTGRIPLIYAVESCHRENVKYLLDKGSDVNNTNDRWSIRFSDRIEGYEEKCRPIYKDLRLHMIRLRAAGLHVNHKKLLISGRWRSLSSRRSAFAPHEVDIETKQYELECKEELEEMKSKISGNGVSPYHILTSKNPRYVLNKTLVKDLESLNHIEFPIYGTLIESKFKSDKRRFSLFETCKRSLSILMERTGGIKPLNEILERIISELQNRDLRNLALLVGLKQSK